MGLEAIASLVIDTFLRTLWSVVRRPLLLLGTVVAFVVAGILALAASKFWTSGWWEDLLLNLGVGLIFVGLIDLVVLGAVRRIIEGTDSRSASMFASTPASSADGDRLDEMARSLARVESMLNASGAWRRDDLPPNRG
jgi:hypothetical protein